METQNYIETGVLELYVYGLLTEEENKEVNELAKKNKLIELEIVSIEKAIVNLSTSFSPFLSAENFEKIKTKLELKHAKVIELKPQTNRYQYIGWAAAVVLSLGIGYQYLQFSESESLVANTQKEKMNLQEKVLDLQQKNQQAVTALAVVRDTKNMIINLGGQTVSPKSAAKVYWNTQTNIVYVDAKELPVPPEGHEYQIWSLKLKPQLTPTSIGMLSNFTANKEKIFTVEKTIDAEAFGITLEPVGGSKSPTMEQLYVLGKV